MTLLNRKHYIHMKYLLLLLLLPFTVVAQSDFIKYAKVEYEKTINMHKNMGEDSWTAELKKQLPVYRKIYFDLIFSPNESYYAPGKIPENDPYSNWGWGDLAQDNKSYASFNEGLVLQQKQIYEEKFLVKDSLLQIEWKILDEIRPIAGFDCRKALGRFNDSLYVVAFYAEEILAPGGPEGFHGLPGLILGIAFPRINTTWFATKVELINPQVVEKQKPLKGGVEVDRSELFATVNKLVSRWKQWDDKANEILWQLPW